VFVLSNAIPRLSSRIRRSRHRRRDGVRRNSCLLKFSNCSTLSQNKYPDTSLSLRQSPRADHWPATNLSCLEVQLLWLFRWTLWPVGRFRFDTLGFGQPPGIIGFGLREANLIGFSFL
jgi:hypothetical protein